MKEFGHYNEKCPDCGELSFEYGLCCSEIAERIVASGKCSACDFVPPSVEWTAETGADAKHEGFDLLAAAYKTWCE